MRWRVLAGLVCLVGVVAVVLVDGGEVAGAQQADGPVGAGWEEPFDPREPWRVSPLVVRVSPGDGSSLEVVGPVTAQGGEEVFEQATVLDPWGRELVAMTCLEGRCRLKTPLGVEEVPGAGVRPGGAFEQGRVTGLEVLAAGGPVVGVEAFGEGGLRVSGAGLGEPIAIEAPLVLEGDPRSPRSFALLGPGGEPVVSVETGPREVASVTVGEQKVRVDEVHARIHGDPFGDEEVLVRVWVDGDRHGFIVKKTPAEAYAMAGQALDEHVVLESPLAGEGVYRFRAGPVAFEGSGALSGAFDAWVQVRTSEGAGFREGWLMVDGEPVSRLTATGQRDGETVFEGLVPAGKTGDGESLFQARLERVHAPGLAEVHRLDPVRVTFDSTGPQPPEVQAEDGALSWPEDPSVAWWEAMVRPVGESEWTRLVLNGTRVKAPASSPASWEGKVRGVDALGNPGPWSPVEAWSSEMSPGERPVPPGVAVTSPGSEQDLEGIVSIEWVTRGEASLVVASVRLDGADGFVRIGDAEEEPIVWDTRTVPDGEHVLRLTAWGAGGSSSVLVPIEVDNLAPVPTEAPDLFETDPTKEADGEGSGWMPGLLSPSWALAGVLVTLGTVIAAGVLGFVEVGGSSETRRRK